MAKENLTEIANFFFEIGSMRRIPRMHRQLLRKSTESISEHSHQATIIGIVLANMEKAEVGKVATMCSLHDVPEARTGDANFIHQQYVEQAERVAYVDQLSGLPGGKQLVTLLDEFNEGETLESKVAHDADMLSQICLQREYVPEKDFKRWHEHTVERLETDSGKELANVIANTSPMDWLYAFAEKPNNK